MPLWAISRATSRCCSKAKRKSAATPIDSPWTEPIRRGIAAGQGEEPLLVPAMGGSLPDYVFTKLLGIPAFIVPYANADEANHAPNENLEVERFFKGIKTGVAMLVEMSR